MRFRFCGEGDCPDWILVQINTLARMSSIKMKLLCQVVAETLVGETPINAHCRVDHITQQRVTSSVCELEKAKKLTSDAKFDEEEVKATVSALTYILTSAAKYGVSEATLANELQQIGFPREHGQALCRVYNERVEGITAELRRTSLRTARLIDVKTRPLGDGRHCDIALTYWSSDTNQEHTKTFTASKTHLASLMHDLKMCSDRLQSLENEI